MQTFNGLNMAFQDLTAGAPIAVLTLPFALQTDAGGLVSIQIKIAGTYSGFTAGPNGRAIIGGSIKFDSPSAGDQVTLIQIKDLDSVIPDDGSRAAWPTYPVLASFIDPGTQNGVGVPLDQQSASTPFIENMASAKFIPSGLYLVANVNKGDGTQDWIRGKLKVIKQLI